MNNPLDTPDVEQLRTIASAINDLRAGLLRLESARDALVRRLDGQGVIGRTAMADVAQLTRGRIWQILNPAYRGDLDGDPDIDHEMLELADALWDQAIFAWHEGGEIGSIDDYFPVDVRRR